MASNKPGIGHNSDGEIISEDLKSYIERIERLDEEIDALAEDKKSVFAEAKSTGFDVKILRKVLARRKKERAEVDAEDELIETYERALGVFG